MGLLCLLCCSVAVAADRGARTVRLQQVNGDILLISAGRPVVASSGIIVPLGSQVLALDGAQAVLVSRASGRLEETPDCQFDVFENSMVLVSDEPQCNFFVVSALDFEQQRPFVRSEGPPDLEGLPIVECDLHRCIELGTAR